LILPAVFAEDSPAPRSVTIDVVIASGSQVAGSDEMTAAALLELEKAGKLQWLVRTRLATIENEKATVRVGENAPVVVGRTARGGFGGDGTQNMTTLVTIGTTIETIAQITGDGSIVVNLSAERTWLEPASAPAEGGEGGPATLPSHRTHTLTSKTTVHVKPGEPTLVASQSMGGKEGSQGWIVLTANTTGSKPAAADKAFSELKVFYLKFAKAADVAKVLESIFDKEPRLKIAVDERINGLVLQGPPATLETLQALLTQLDDASRAAERD
jgi:type II secretory pathway component GspD/PulD (secretin)